MKTPLQLKFISRCQHRDIQNKTILQRALPATLKLSIAKNIENHLFSKVKVLKIICLEALWLLHFSFQVSFLLGLGGIGEIRTLFAAEV